jgi:hypothetical protein
MGVVESTEDYGQNGQEGGVGKTSSPGGAFKRA